MVSVRPRPASRPPVHEDRTHGECLRLVAERAGGLPDEHARRVHDAELQVGETHRHAREVAHLDPVPDLGLLATRHVLDAHPHRVAGRGHVELARRQQDVAPGHGAAVVRDPQPLLPGVPVQALGPARGLQLHDEGRPGHELLPGALPVELGVRHTHHRAHLGPGGRIHGHRQVHGEERGREQAERRAVLGGGDAGVGAEREQAQGEGLGGREARAAERTEHVLWNLAYARRCGLPLDGDMSHERKWCEIGQPVHRAGGKLLLMRRAAPRGAACRIAPALLCLLSGPANATMPPRDGPVPPAVAQGFASGLFSVPERLPALEASAGPVVWRLPIIRVAFSDSAIVHPAAALERRLFDVSGAEPRGSMIEYYLWVSRGRLIVTGEVVATVVLPHPREWYSGSNHGVNMLGSPHNAYGLFRDVLYACDAQVDFSRFDLDTDGMVDMLWVLHAGPGAETTGDADDMWSITSRAIGGWSNATPFDTNDPIAGSELAR